MKLVLVAFELDVAVWCYRRRHHHCYCYRRHRRLHVLVVVELCLDCEHLLASSKRNISVVIPPVSAAGCANVKSVQERSCCCSGGGGSGR